MKLYKKKLIKASLLMVLIGTVLSVTAAVLGANTSVYWSRGFNARYLRDISFEEVLQPFSIIDISLIDMSMDIRYGDTFSIQASGYSYIPLQHNVMGGRLSVSNDQRMVVGTALPLISTTRYNFNERRDGGGITVTIPYGTSLNVIDLHIVGNHNVLVNDIVSTNVNIDNVGGNVMLYNVDFSNTSLYSIGGSVIALGDFTGLLQISTTGGDINLTLPNLRQSYSYSFETWGGNLFISGDSNYGHGMYGNVRVNRHHTANNPHAVIDVDSFGGNIVVNFGE